MTWEITAKLDVMMWMHGGWGRGPLNGFWRRLLAQPHESSNLGAVLELRIGQKCLI